MAIFILPHAQEDLLSLQEYMLDHWTESLWINAEDEIFAKLDLVDSGLLAGSHVPELVSVGIFEYQMVFTSHHKLVYRRMDTDTYVYTVAGHQQDFQTLLLKRLLKI